MLYIILTSFLSDEGSSIKFDRDIGGIVDESSGKCILSSSIISFGFSIESVIRINGRNPFSSAT